jgi:hypothetical protein
MTEKTFYDELCKNISKAYPSAQISVVDIVKHDETYKGVKVSFDRGLISPVFNIDKLNSSVKKFEDVSQIISIILEEIKRNVIFNEIDLNIFDDYEKLKPHLCVDVVDFKNNERFLSTVPYQLFNKDMAIIVKAVLSNELDNIERCPMTTITNDMLRHINVSREEICKDAIKNSSDINPPEILKASDFLFKEDYVESPETPLHDNTKIPVKIITTKTGICQSSVLLNLNIMEDLTHKYNSSFYLVPTTIGVWTIPDNYLNSKQFTISLAKMLNEDKLLEDTKLIGEIHYYNKDTKTLEPNSVLEKRNQDIIEREKKDAKKTSEKPKAEKNKELEM